MPRADDRDLSKEHAWREIFAAHRASKLSAAEFCRKHSLRISQFYEWRRKIEDRDSALAAEARSGTSMLLLESVVRILESH